MGGREMDDLAKWENDDAVRALRAIRAAAVVRDKDGLNRAIRGVLLTEGFAVATDMYCLINVPLQYEGSDFVLPELIVDRLSKIRLSARMSFCTLLISESDGMIHVKWSAEKSGDVMEVMSATEEHEPYPSWRNIMVSPDDYKIDASQSAWFAVDLFSRVYKVASELGDRDALIRLEHMIGLDKKTVWTIRSPKFGDVMWMQMPVKK